MAKEDWTKLPNGSWKYKTGTIIKPTGSKMGEMFFWDIIWIDGTVEGVLHWGSKQAVAVVESGIAKPAPPRRKK